MINDVVLEESFQMIGLRRIPHYIDLFMEKNKNFQIKSAKYFKKKDYDSLINLLHKTRGSFSIFHPDQIIIIFVNAEDLLTNHPHKFDIETLGFITTAYNEFCEELIAFREKYALIT
jgi:hypothetical protein